MTEPAVQDEATISSSASSGVVRSPGADRLISASTVAAWLCLALIVAGLLFGLLPVRNPKVQDCGTPLVFVLTGRVDTFVDPNSPPKGMTAAQAEAANKRPCRKRVAPRVVHSSELLLGGLVVGLAGVILLLIGRSGRRKALLRAFPGAAISRGWISPSEAAPAAAAEQP